MNNLISSIWDFLFQFLEYLISFGSDIINLMDSPLLGLITDYIPLSFIAEALLDILVALGILNAEITFLQFILTVGAPFILVFGFVKFFADIVS